MPLRYPSRRPPSVRMQDCGSGLRWARPSDRRKVARSAPSGTSSRPSSSRRRLSSSRAKQASAAFRSLVRRVRLNFRLPYRKTMRNVLPRCSMDAMSRFSPWAAERTSDTNPTQRPRCPQFVPSGHLSRLGGSVHR